MAKTFNLATLKKAFITGITGQDGSYLLEFLLNCGYEVHGLVRRSSTFNRQRIDHIFQGQAERQAYLHYGDMTDLNSLISILSNVRPDEIYNLAAQSHVGISFEEPSYTAQATGFGVLNILEAVRLLGLNSKIYQASTSEIFSGDPQTAPQNEATPFQPQSPYGLAKLYGFHAVKIYRDAYGMFTCNGILFNHESPRRGENFVTRKITIGAAKIAHGKQDIIHLGNLNAKRDWGYAPEYVEAMWLMLQQPKAEDFVIATGETHSVREFAEEAFKNAEMEIIWDGQGINERGLDKKTGKTVIKIDPHYFRPLEIHHLRGNPTKAAEKLGWKPKIDFKNLVRIMMESDLRIY